MEEQDITEQLKKELEDIKFELSSLRKKGIDTKIADLKIMNIPSKINMIKITKSSRDIGNVKRLMISAWQEITVIKKEAGLETEPLSEKINEIRNPNKNIPDQAPEFKLANQLIQEANNFINSKKYNEAHELYTKINEVYRKLPKESKAQIYKSCMDIHKSLLGNQSA